MRKYFRTTENTAQILKTFGNVKLGSFLGKLSRGDHYKSEQNNLIYGDLNKSFIKNFELNSRN
jgi:hypothetical protein